MLTPFSHEISGGNPTESKTALKAYLRYLSFNGRHRDAFHLFSLLDEEQRKGVEEDICIESSVILGAAQEFDTAHKDSSEYIRRRLNGIAPAIFHTGAGDPGEMDAVSILTDYVGAIIERCGKRQEFPQELYDALDAWSNVLGSLGRHPERIEILNKAFRLPIHKHPQIRLGCVLLLAKAYLQVGEARKAMSLVETFLAKPYLIPSRSGLNDVLYTASQAALAIPDIDRFIPLAFSFLRSFTTDTNSKIHIAEQLVRWHRGRLGLLFANCRDASTLALAIAFLALGERSFRSAKWLHWAGRACRQASILLLYLRNYSQPDHLKRWPGMSASRRLRGKILITRAMGGIGDLLMMTPGIAALKAARPGTEIHLAIPRAFFPLFLGNASVVLKDIDNDAIEPTEYEACYNLSDCPASRVESRTAPAVKQNRIDIFARAMSVSTRQLDRLGRIPTYIVSDEEREFAGEFLAEKGLRHKAPIGIHPYTADSYRDYPQFECLAELLSRDYPVIVFHSAPLAGFNYPNVIKADQCSIRQSAALLQRCALLAAPDSSLMHIAAALGVPALAVFGPTDGRLRTGDYPGVEFVDLRHRMKCVPCWRHEYSPCRVSGTRTSICIHSIDVHDLHQRILSKLQSLPSAKL